MCTVCGCSGTGGHAHGHQHPHAHDHHGHDHAHAHGDGARGAAPQHLDFGGGIAGVHLPGMSQERVVRIERDILAMNDEYARGNRRRLAERGVLALNLVSSPGSGKTTLLARTIEALRGRLESAVIEGDQQTSRDAERIRAAGAPAVQINTGKGCHLDAHMVGHALERLPLERGGVLFIENVGNLVCPAAFDLGEAHKVAILSVTEGEDKPLKYPDMFRAASLLLLSKIDLLPQLEFDLDACVAMARRVNPRIEVQFVSAKNGDGMLEWRTWIEARARSAADRGA